MFVAVLSDKPELREEFCKSLGKEASRNEVVFYSPEQAKHITLMDPAGYPEKIQPLLYSLSMADYIVFIVDTLTPKVGEMIVALNSLKCENGIVVSKSPLPLAGTTLEKFEKVDSSEAAKTKVLSLQPIQGGENVFGLIDHMENVKSLGNVARGVLKSGKVKKADKLFVLPDSKEIEVRSIHLGDSEVEELSAGARFSIAYKGDSFGHGVLVPLRNEHEIGNVINGKFNKSPFYKDEIKGKIHAYSNMQFVEGTLNESDITLSHPLAYEKGELILIVDASNQKLRIIGAFQSKW
jgi:selenocysteine-specific translation elongation factor